MLGILRMVRLGVDAARWAAPHVQDWKRQRNFNEDEAWRNLEAKNWGEAEKYFLAALEESRHGDPKRIEFLLGLAEAQRKQSRSTPAEESARKALDLATQTKNHLSRLEALDILVDLHLDQERVSDAHQLAEEAVQLESQRSKPDPKRMVKHLRKLGDVCLRKRDFEKAEEAFENSVKMAEQSFGSEHPETAESLLGLGGALRQMGRHADAQLFLRGALEIHRQAHGQDSHQVSRDLHELAGSLEESGDIEAAMAEYEKALTMRERQLGVDPEETAELKMRLGKLYLECGRSSSAREMLIHAMRVFEKSADDRYLEALDVMARAEDHAGRGKEAQRLRQKAEIVTATRGKTSNRKTYDLVDTLSVATPAPMTTPPSLWREPSPVPQPNNTAVPEPSYVPLMKPRAVAEPAPFSAELEQLFHGHYQRPDHAAPPFESAAHWEHQPAAPAPQPSEFSSFYGQGGQTSYHSRPPSETVYPTRSSGHGRGDQEPNWGAPAPPLSAQTSGAAQIVAALSRTETPTYIAVSEPNGETSSFLITPISTPGPTHPIGSHSRNTAALLSALSKQASHEPISQPAPSTGGAAAPAHQTSGIEALQKVTAEPSPKFDSNSGQVLPPSPAANWHVSKDAVPAALAHHAAHADPEPGAEALHARIQLAQPHAAAPATPPIASPSPAHVAIQPELVRTLALAGPLPETTRELDPQPVPPAMQQLASLPGPAKPALGKTAAIADPAEAIGGTENVQSVISLPNAPALALLNARTAHQTPHRPESDLSLPSASAIALPGIGTFEASAPTPVATSHASTHLAPALQPSLAPLSISRSFDLAADTVPADARTESAADVQPSALAESVAIPIQVKHSVKADPRSIQSESLLPVLSPLLQHSSAEPAGPAATIPLAIGPLHVPLPLPQAPPLAQPRLEGSALRTRFRLEFKLPVGAYDNAAQTDAGPHDIGSLGAPSSLAPTVAVRFGPAQLNPQAGTVDSASISASIAHSRSAQPILATHATMQLASAMPVSGAKITSLLVARANPVQVQAALDAAPDSPATAPHLPSRELAIEEPVHLPLSASRLPLPQLAAHAWQDRRQPRIAPIFDEDRVNLPAAPNATRESVSWTLAGGTEIDVVVAGPPPVAPIPLIASESMASQAPGLPDASGSSIDPGQLNFARALTGALIATGVAPARVMAHSAELPDFADPPAHLPQDAHAPAQVSVPHGWLLVADSNAALAEPQSQDQPPLRSSELRPWLPRSRDTRVRYPRPTQQKLSPDDLDNADLGAETSTKVEPAAEPAVSEPLPSFRASAHTVTLDYEIPLFDPAAERSTPDDELPLFAPERA